MSDLAQFLQLVVSAYDGSLPNEVRGQAYQTLERLRAENPFQLLAGLLGILQLPEVPHPTIKQLAFVLAHTTLKKIESPNPTVSREGFIQSQSGTLMTDLLSACSSFFGVYPKETASLFSAIAGVLMESTDAAVVEMLLKQIAGVQDCAFLMGVFMAIEETVDDYEIGEEEYPMVMTHCFQLMQADVPMDLKRQIMKVISSMVDKMDVIFQNESNIGSVQQLIMYAVNTPELKSMAYLSLGELAEYHFAVFGAIATDVMQLAVADLQSGNHEIINGICYLVREIANTESDLETQVIIPAVFPAMFPILVGIYVTHGDPEPWEADDYNVFINIVETLADVISMFWESLAPAMMEFVVQNNASESAELRELTAHVMDTLASIGPFAESNIAALAGFSAEKLQDPAVRVRQVAASIIKEFASESETIKPALVQLLPMVVTHLADEQHVVLMVLEALERMAKCKIIPNFHELFKVVAPLLTHENMSIVQKAANVLMSGADNVLHFETMVAAWPDVVQLVGNSCTNPVFKRDQEGIIGIFFYCCKQMMGHPSMAQVIQQLTPVLLQDYMASRENSLIHALGGLAASLPAAYQPFLVPTMEVAADMISRAAECGDVYLEDCTGALNTMVESGVPIESFIAPLVEAMMTLVAANPGNMRRFARVVDFVTRMLMSKKHGIRTAVDPVVRPILQHINGIAEMLTQAIDRENAESLICASLRFVQYFLRENCETVSQMPAQYIPLLFKLLASATTLWNACDEDMEEEMEECIINVMAFMPNLDNAVDDLDDEGGAETVFTNALREFIMGAEPIQRLISHILGRGNLTMNSAVKVMLADVGLKDIIEQQTE